MESRISTSDTASCSPTATLTINANTELVSAGTRRPFPHPARAHELEPAPNATSFFKRWVRGFSFGAEGSRAEPLHSAPPCDVRVVCSFTRARASLPVGKLGGLSGAATPATPAAPATLARLVRLEITASPVRTARRRRRVSRVGPGLQERPARGAPAARLNMAATSARRMSMPSPHVQAPPPLRRRRTRTFFGTCVSTVQRCRSFGRRRRTRTRGRV